MKIPDGLSHTSLNLVCKLKKSLYGIKQSSRQWFAQLSMELLHQGFVQSKKNYSRFIKRTSTSFTIFAVYVGDIIITGDHMVEIQSIKSKLNSIFSIKEFGRLHYFLSLEVSYTAEGILLTQQKFTNDLLHDYELCSFKKVVTPLPVNLKL